MVQESKRQQKRENERENISGIDWNQSCISSLEDAIDENNPIRYTDVYAS